MECEKCSLPFRSDLRRAKFLPCGHSLCVVCLHSHAEPRCPVCAKGFRGTVAELPDNLAVMRLVDAVAEKRAGGLWCLECFSAASLECEERHATLKMKAAVERAVLELQDSFPRLCSGLQDAMRGLMDSCEQMGVALMASIGISSCDLTLRRKTGEEYSASWLPGSGHPERDQLLRVLTFVLAKQGALRQVCHGGKDGGNNQEKEFACNKEVTAAPEPVAAATAFRAVAAATAATLAAAPAAAVTVNLDHDEAVDLKPVLEPDIIVLENPKSSRGQGLKSAQSELEEKPEAADVAHMIKRLRHQLGKQPVKEGTQATTATQATQRSAVTEVIEELNVYELTSVVSASDAHGDLLQQVLDRGVRRLMNVMCVADSWCLLLLRCAAPQLEELSLYRAKLVHLEALQDMPKLRRLHVFGDSASSSSPSPYVLSLPAKRRGLEFLSARNMPRKWTLEMLRAHGSTLQEVHLLVGSHGTEWPAGCSNLHLALLACNLRALRSIRLSRRDESVKTNHETKRCKQQLYAVRRVFSEAKVFCCECS